MSSTTYTMLVTIAHDDGAAPSTDLLEVMVQRGLEEGVREFAGVHAATVSAADGDWLACKPLETAPALRNMKRLHKELRA